MTNSYYTFTTLWIAVLCLLSPAKNNNTFSQTQKLDPKLVEVSKKSSLLDISWNKISRLPTPPNNLQEAQFISKFQQKNFSPSLQMRIEEQSNFDFYYFGSKLFKDKPNTIKLFELTQHEIIIATLGQKLKFDRVRPSFVDPTIRTLIKIPNHPSYPSEHAAQAHAFAILLSALDQDNKKKYMKLSDEIIEYREIAGLHFRSDTYIGKRYAKFIFRKMLQKPLFKAIFIDAAQEWGATSKAIPKLENLKTLCKK